MCELLLISGLNYREMLGMTLRELGDWHALLVRRYNQLHGAE